MKKIETCSVYSSKDPSTIRGLRKISVRTAEIWRGPKVDRRRDRHLLILPKKIYFSLVAKLLLRRKQWDVLPRMPLQFADQVTR